LITLVNRIKTELVLFTLIAVMTEVYADLSAQ